MSWLLRHSDVVTSVTVVAWEMSCRLVGVWRLSDSVLLSVVRASRGSVGGWGSRGRRTTGSVVWLTSRDRRGPWQRPPGLPGRRCAGGAQTPTLLSRGSAGTWRPRARSPAPGACGGSCRRAVADRRPRGPPSPAVAWSAYRRQAETGRHSYIRCRTFHVKQGSRPSRTALAAFTWEISKADGLMACAGNSPDRSAIQRWIENAGD